jgi:hypothetical protein
MQVGAGEQTVKWLRLAACQRYQNVHKPNGQLRGRGKTRAGFLLPGEVRLVTEKSHKATADCTKLGVEDRMGNSMEYSSSLILTRKRSKELNEWNSGQVLSPSEKLCDAIGEQMGKTVVVKLAASLGQSNEFKLSVKSDSMPMLPDFAAKVTV